MTQNANTAYLLVSFESQHFLFGDSAWHGIHMHQGFF